MVCRVCGGQSPEGQPCYRCMLLLIDCFCKYTPKTQKEKARIELSRIVEVANDTWIPPEELKRRAGL